jgi:plastocyanin
LLACFAFTACGRDQTRSSSSSSTPAAETAASGRIWGVVRFQGAPPVARAEPTGQDQAVCGQSVPVTRLALGAGNGVQNAFIYLEGISGGDNVQTKLVAEVVDQTGCQYGPHVMTAPVGTQLEIVNNDPILHNVHARHPVGDALQTIFNIAQPVRGQRTKVDARLDKTGVVSLSCEAGHPWMTAHVLVAEHPYVAVTDAEGSFVITGVPAGTYPITMWHEGVRLTRVVTSLQRYEYEDPYESTQTVTVPAGGEAVVTFDLALRPEEQTAG